jgi:hypothetical protein
MTRKPKPRAKAKTRTKRKVSLTKRAAPRIAKPDPLDGFITAAAKTLDLPAKKAWLPAVRMNLRVTLAHAAAVAEFDLPDDAEPAPVFRA